MKPLDWHMVNSPGAEAWPARLVRARASADARVVSRADWVLRRKHDGRFLAALGEGRLHALVPGLSREPGLDSVLTALGAPAERAGDLLHLPLDGLHDRLHWLGLDEGYGERTGLALFAEPSRLEYAGLDRYRRVLWLIAPAARGWRRMHAAALADGITLQAISGYRSHDHQLGIFERKLARGLSVEQILTVNAAPGYSEHHGGVALDIGAPGEPPAEESFDATPAFAWLQQCAREFGFRMSYPRDNPHGITYEPWHWRWHPAG
jgi:D-alanyl-D-alanine carboxypeptidase